MGESSSNVNPDAVLVCAGDSLTAGLNPNSDSDTYVARLRDHLGCKVINAGVADDRTADLLARLDKDVLEHDPTAVLVFIGGNDYLNSTPRRELTEHLDRLVSRIAKTRARIVLVEMPSGIVLNPHAGVYRQVARRYEAVLVPDSHLRWWYLRELLFRELLSNPLTLDGVHLSRSGAMKVAD